jgi:hypothetical protein
MKLPQEADAAYWQRVADYPDYPAWTLEGYLEDLDLDVAADRDHPLWTVMATRALYEAQQEVINVGCPRCGSTSTRTGPGKGPHHARLACAGCGRFIKWLPKPDPQE